MIVPCVRLFVALSITQVSERMRDGQAVLLPRMNRVIGTVIITRTLKVQDSVNLRPALLWRYGGCTYEIQCTARLVWYI